MINMDEVFMLVEPDNVASIPAIVKEWILSRMISTKNKIEGILFT